jgi:DNA-binding IclR family transcriptional regulator
VSEEFEAELVGVAAPVRDFRGYVVGAVNISAPKFRLGRSLAAAGREVRASAERLSRALTGEPAQEQIPAALNPLGKIS